MPYRFRRRQYGRVHPAVAAAAAGLVLAALTHAPATPTATGTSTPAAAASGPAATAIGYARAQLGKPYLWGGTGPDAFDCSGLVQAAWGAAGVAIPRTSQAQWTGLHHIDPGTLEPGDLVFYTGYLTAGEQPPGHVVMYIGGGKIIEAYATGYPIRITALRGGIWGAARPGGA